MIRKRTGHCYAQYQAIQPRCWRKTDFWKHSLRAFLKSGGKYWGPTIAVIAPSRNVPVELVTKAIADTWKWFIFMLFCPFSAASLLFLSFHGPHSHIPIISYSLDSQEHLACLWILRLSPTPRKENTLARTVFLKMHMTHMTIFLNFSSLSKSLSIVLTPKGSYIGFPR